LRKQLINVAIPPVFSRLERANHRMLARVIMLGGVFVLRRIATTHVSATQAEPQVNPGVAHLQAFFTTLALRLSVFRGLNVTAGLSH
jgi:hypothetical protein